MVIQGYPDPGEGLRLHLNENTGGCSAAVLEAIRRVRPSDVSTYPSYRDAVTATAAHFGVDPDCVLLTNGLDEGILMAAVGHIARKRVHDAETIIPLPAFDPYPNSTAAVGATAVRVPPGRDFAFPTQAVHRRGDAADAHDLPEYAEQPDRAVDPDRGPGPHQQGCTRCRGPDRRGVYRVRRHELHSRICRSFRTCCSGARSRRRTVWQACASAW